MQPSIAALWFLAITVTGSKELGTISSAELCGSCHRAIHMAWKKSAHSTAMESRLFQDALELAERDYGGNTRRVCLECHSPLAIQLDDLSLKQKTSWEGVTCDYCHSMRGVSMDAGNARPILNFASVKSGPMRESSSVAHGTIFSEVHTSSLVCAPCHEYRNPLGLGVVTTLTEWKSSRFFKENIQCQSCHMYRVAGNVVDPRVQSSSGAKVNLHEMPGGHSIEQLNKAMRMRLITSRKEDRVDISVELSNVGAGHHVPTGSPMRQLILEVKADPYKGKGLFEKRTYRRVVADKDGKGLSLEHVALLNAAKVVSDNRLAAGETRNETFSLPISAGVPVQVTARLIYYYSPMARAESQEQLMFQSLSRFVK